MAPEGTALILAGGQSTRFGGDKARYEIGGTAMIRRVYDAVAAVCGDVLVSVGEAGVHYPLPGSVRYVVDPVAGAGPLAGLTAGLRAARAPWVLAVACDMPFLTPEVLHALLGARTKDASAVVAVTPDERTHPLCACYARRILPQATAHLEGGRRALHALLDVVTAVVHVPVPAGPLRNVNTRQDVENSRTPAR